MVLDYNAELARQIKANIGAIFPMYSPMHLPSARGIWPIGNGTAGANSNDISGRGRHLTDAGGVTYNIDNFLEYANLNGSTEYLFLADVVAIDITGNLGMGCWVYFDNTASATEFIMGKWTNAANQRSYRLIRVNTGVIQAQVSTNGTTVVSISSTAIVAANTWAFVAMSYDPSTSLSVFVGQEGGDNGMLEKTENTTSIPASIFNSNADFAIGARDTSATPASFLTGRASTAYLCSALMPDKMHNLIYAQTRALLVV